MKRAEFLYEVNEVVWGMKIKDQIRIKKYKDREVTTKGYEYECTICSYRGTITESRIKRMKSLGCACCKGQVIDEHINSIVAKEENHWMIEYFIGGYEEAKLYAPQSSKTIEMICPICKRTKSNKICNLYHRKSIGCTCNSGISRLERVISEVLFLNDIQYIKEYKLEGYTNKRYDFFLPELNILIEAHGGQHYRVGRNSIWEDLKTVQENDMLKYDMAVNRGYNCNESYFIIECPTDRVEDIYQQLADLPFISLTEEELKECLISSTKDHLKDIKEYLEAKPQATKNELCKYFGFSKEKLSALLRRGVREGIISYDTTQYERLNTPGRKVYVYKDEKLVYEFDSVSHCLRYMTEHHNFPYKNSYMRKLCLENKNYKKFSFSFNHCERLSE